MEDYITNEFFISIPYWQYIILGLIVIALLFSVYAQVKISRADNPYYGLILPFVMSILAFIISYHLILTLIPFGIYGLVYLIARFNGKRRKVEKLKVDVKDL